MFIRRSRSSCAPPPSWRRRIPKEDELASRTVDNAGLDADAGYAVFAQVIEGMDVVDAIVAVPTTTVGQFENVPVDAITITSVTLE